MSDLILMGHGSGGRMMHQLIRDEIAPMFGIETFADSAVLTPEISGKLVFTTDSHVVSPIFFPDSDIGELSVCGTVNDLAVMGAQPLYLTAGFILEEGFPLGDLRRVVKSMARAAQQAKVKIVAGDTKVVERGRCEGIYINTAGIGVLPHNLDLSPSKIKADDKIIVSGNIGTHGIAVMAKRNGLTFDPPIKSDVAALNSLTAAMLESGADIKMMRDPTRGGLATTLKEIALESSFRILLEEEPIPVLPGVRGGCELLGLDPLFVANEGVLVVIVAKEHADDLLKTMKRNPLGKHAAVIGEVSTGQDGKVLLRAKTGGTLILDMLAGEQLPRIC